MDRYILSLDLGTTAIKVAIVNLQGRLLSTATKEYQLLTPDTLSVELPVDTYWKAFREGLKEAVADSGISSDQLECLGISAQGETLIIIDKNGTPLRNAIVWMDNRAQKEAEELNAVFDIRETYKITGQVSIVPTWPAAKLLWLKKHEPENFKKIYKALLIEDYFIYKLTGKFVCEGSLFCSTVYWDINTKKWWKPMLQYIGISSEQLPEIKESGEVVGTINPEIAKELGLSKSFIIATGALDQAAGAIGVGNIKSGMFSENTGAALAICATVNKSFMDKDQLMPCHYHGIKDLYMAHTFTTGGMVMKWFRDGFCSQEAAVGDLTGFDPYDLMSREAMKVPPGSNGLIMLPHLSGAMAPEANPKAKGVFYGATLKHTKAHFIRAIMESIGFIVLRNIRAIEKMGLPVEEIRILGGGSKSSAWNQIKADITGKKVCTTANSDAACLGAAIISGTATGLFKSLQEAVSEMVVIKETFTPDMKNHELYIKQFEKYLALYDAMCPIFDMN